MRSWSIVAGVCEVVLLVGALITAGSTARAAEISRSPAIDDGRVDILIEGRIGEGDAAAFRAVIDSILDDGLRAHVARLNSQGGSITEAFKIGDTIRLLKLDTAAPTRLIWNAYCDSACFIIWAAGTGRYGDDLRVHRPIIHRSGFARFTPEQASFEYQALAREVESKLKLWGISDAVIRRMMAVSSLEIAELDDTTIAELRDDPAFSELVIARCGCPAYSSGPTQPVFNGCSGDVLNERLDEGIRKYRAAYALR